MKKSTPLPYHQIFVLGCILAANNISIWMIFSYLPFMVQWFFPSLDTKELGYKAGLLAAAFSCGSLIANFIWGYLSDIYGRRPILICGLIGTSIASFLFGFSSSFEMAILSRFLWGLLNGNLGVSKCYIGEILDDSNNAKGMALFGVIGGIGRTIGPVIGGYLSQPALQYPSFFKGELFDTFPFALPSLVVCFNCLIVVVLAYFYLPETLCLPSHPSPSKGEISYGPLSTNEETDDTEKNNQYNIESNASPEETDQQLVPHSSDIELTRREPKNLTPSFPPNINITHSDLKPEQGHRQGQGQEGVLSSVCQIFRSRPILVSTSLYGLMGFVTIAGNELFPLWVVTEYRDGGFQWTAHHIGTATMIAGSLSVLSQLTIYDKLVERGGALFAFRLGAGVWACTVMLLPLISLISLPNHSYPSISLDRLDPNLPPPSLFSIRISNFFLGLGLSVMNVTAMWSFITVFLFINNSCYPHQRGMVNALGQSLASLGRLTGPLLGANLFAWSETRGQTLGWPFNFCLSWYVVGTLAFFSAGLSFLLEPSIEKRKK